MAAELPSLEVLPSHQLHINWPRLHLRLLPTLKGKVWAKPFWKWFSKRKHHSKNSFDSSKLYGFRKVHYCLPRKEVQRQLQCCHNQIWMVHWGNVANVSKAQPQNQITREKRCLRGHTWRCFSKRAWMWPKADLSANLLHSQRPVWLCNLGVIRLTWLRVDPHSRGEMGFCVFFCFLQHLRM